jgi:energy-coupling factor transporter ATP-binding protein EcfA2
MTSDYDAFVSFWPDTDGRDDPHPMLPSDILNITDVDIRRGDFHLRLADLMPIPFFQGAKILIQGGTGSGKSTLIDGITGKTPGVTMSFGAPENYYHCTVDMFQGIRSKLPSSGVTIRDFFSEEPSDAVIMEHLAVTFMPDELVRWLALLGTDNANPFDSNLNERLSGGQKSRLILATRSYMAEGKNIIVLDEPEQGSDGPVIVSVLNRFIAKHRLKTVVMITHMCQCQLDQLQVHWDASLYVQAGVVYRV